jgi:hypothetical protein
LRGRGSSAGEEAFAPRIGWTLRDVESNFSASFSTISRSAENERAVNIHRRVKMGERPWRNAEPLSAFSYNHSAL